MEVYQSLAQAILEGELERVETLLAQAVRQGIPADALLRQGLLAGLAEVGERFAREEMFLPEVTRSAKAAEKGLTLLRPYLVGSREKGSQMRGRVVLGTVENDIHDIGKKLVGMLFTAHGFEVIDLGVNVKPERFVAACREYRPDFLGLSALLTTTMPGMPKTLRSLEEAGLRDGRLKVMVGGAPVTREFAQEIGADLYADDAVEAVALAESLLENR